MTVLETPAEILKFRRRAFLAYDWDSIQSQKGLFSHGDTLMELAPEHLNQSYCQHLIDKYQRVIFYGDAPDRKKIRSYLTGADYFISSKFTLIEGNRHKIIPLCQQVQLRDHLPVDLQLMELSGPDQLDSAERLEHVQGACGLDPLPAAFMADSNLSRTVYLASPSGDIACVSTVASLSNAKGEWASSAMVLRTSVLPDYRRLGLGTYIKAKAILAAHKAFQADRYVGIVGGNNVASFKINSAVGLSINPAGGFLGVENRQ